MYKRELFVDFVTMNGFIVVQDTKNKYFKLNIIIEIPQHNLSEYAVNALLRVAALSKDEFVKYYLENKRK